jgi:hypothetical protein
MRPFPPHRVVWDHARPVRRTPARHPPPPKDTAPARPTNTEEHDHA